MTRDITMPEFVELIRKHFHDSDIQHIVEVGSMDGRDAVYFKEQFPHASVIAIEGNKENFYAYNPQDSGVKWMNAVVFNYDGQIDFHIKNINGIHSVYDRGKIYGERKESVDCFRLDSLIENVDMMKIDVEGATYEVLDGMGNLLDSVKIMHIETESYPFFSGQKLHGAVENLLKEKGFRMIAKADCRIQNGYQHDSVWIGRIYEA